MARKRKDDPERSEGGLGDFVPAVFARSREEAEDYCELLNDHDIPAIVGEDELPEGPAKAAARPVLRKGMTRGVPVLVPEVMLDEASEVIADREYEVVGGEEADEADEEVEEGEGLAPGPEHDEAAAEGEPAAEEDLEADEDVFEEDEEDFLQEQDEDFDDDLEEEAEDEDEEGDLDEGPEEDEN